MLYVVIGVDVAGSLDRRQAALPAHLRRLAELQDAGRLIVAGPCPLIDSPDPGPAGYSGSVIIADFDSLAEARTWAEADPYVAAGVYGTVAVKPFSRMLPA